MKHTDFKSLYKRMIEAHGLSPKAAKEILKTIFRRLSTEKEKRHEML